MEDNTMDIPQVEYNEEEINVPSSREKNNKRKRKKKRRKKHYILRLIILIVLIVALVVCMNIPYFGIKTIKIEGNKYMSEKQVLKDTKIKTGDNIIKTTKRQIKKRMSSNPYYESISINKNLPDEVIITVKERTPMAVLPYGDRYVVLDIEGRVLGLEDTNPKLTEISGITIKNMEKCEIVDAKSPKVLDKSLEVLVAMEQNDLFFKKISIDGNKVVINVYDSLYIKGKTEQVLTNIKNGNLETILYDLYKKKIKRGTVKVDGKEYCSFTPTF